MGKTRKTNKYAVRDSEKLPLDEQINAGRVVRSKNKVKIRLRADDEEEVSVLFGLILKCIEIHLNIRTPC